MNRAFWKNISLFISNNYVIKFTFRISRTLNQVNSTTSIIQSECVQPERINKKQGIIQYIIEWVDIEMFFRQRIHRIPPPNRRIIPPGPIVIPPQPKILIPLLAVVPVLVPLYTAFTSKNSPLYTILLTTFSVKNMPQLKEKIQRGQQPLSPADNSESCSGPA